MCGGGQLRAARKFDSLNHPVVDRGNGDIEIIDRVVSIIKTAPVDRGRDVKLKYSTFMPSCK